MLLDKMAAHLYSPDEVEARENVLKEQIEDEKRFAKACADNEAEMRQSFDEGRMTVDELIADLAKHKAALAWAWRENQTLNDAMVTSALEYSKNYFEMTEREASWKASSAGVLSGQSRAENANKNKVVDAWHTWQNHPSKQPYGDGRGSKRAFDEAMIKTNDANPISVSAWRRELQRNTKIDT